MFALFLPHAQTLEYAEADFETVRMRLNTQRQETIPAFEEDR